MANKETKNENGSREDFKKNLTYLSQYIRTRIHTHVRTQTHA